MVLIQLLLRRPGLLVHSHEPFGEGSVGLFVNAADVEEAKQVLAEFCTRDASGNEVPIPW